MRSKGFIVPAQFYKGSISDDGADAIDLHVEDPGLGPITNDDEDTWIISVWVEPNNSFLVFTRTEALAFREALTEIINRYPYQEADVK